MEMTFELGQEAEPRGHALVYFHDVSQSTQVLATYFIVLPVALDISKYIPPMFAAQMGAIGVDEVSAFAVPPVPDKVESYEQVRRLAELRGDDLIYGGKLSVGDLQGTVTQVNEGVQLYARRYLEFQQRSPQGELPAFEVSEVMYQLMGTRGRLEELSKLLGRLRFAVDGNDRRAAEEAEQEIDVLARMFTERYQMRSLVAAARTPGARGGKLAQLYLDRCYRLVEEDFKGVQEVEGRIREHEGMH